MATLGGLWRRHVRGTPRARVVSDAVGVALVGLLLIAVGLVGTWTAQPPERLAPERWWHAVPLLAICAVMLAKRHHPVAALLVGLGIFAADVALGGSIGTLLGLIGLIYSAALFASPTSVRRLRDAVAATVVGGTAAVFVVAGDLRQAVNVALLLFAVGGTPLWWGLSVRQQSDLAALATTRAADLERLARMREAQVVREERARMARDLHDALSGNLSAIAIHAEAALAGADAAAQRDALALIRGSSVRSMNELRALIVLLRADVDAAAAETTAPNRLVDLEGLLATARASGLAVDARVDDLPELPAAVDQAAYRIVQEALTNAAKHTNGGSVDVSVGVVADALEVEVVSDTERAPVSALTPAGAGGASAAEPSGKPAGVGLLSMRERAEALGGTFTAGWEPAGAALTGPEPARWRVRATLPLGEAHG